MFGQTVAAQFENMSFENVIPDKFYPTPAGWFGCQQGSTPDALPGVWDVTKKAADGDFYAGLLTRDDGSYESFGQRLSQTLKKSGCYTLTLDLARSEEYKGYNQPVKLRIWGSSNKCGKGQLIAESKLIRNTRWQAFSFAFLANSDIKYIIFEAYHPGNQPIKGNVLIDNIRPLKRCVRASL